jgi:hypothetical protein
MLAGAAGSNRKSGNKRIHNHPTLRLTLGVLARQPQRLPLRAIATRTPYCGRPMAIDSESAGVAAFRSYHCPAAHAAIRGAPACAWVVAKLALYGANLRQLRRRMRLKEPCSEEPRARCSLSLQVHAARPE